MDLFVNHPWPGNVRQLEHAIEHGFILSKGDEIGIEHLPQEFLSEFRANSTHRPSSGLENLRSREKEIIFDCLKKHRWNKVSVSRELSVSRSTLWRKMKDLEIPLNPL
jgi:DNA-binding NtrC family response regulator